jgi:hypothetical protein
VHHTVQGWLIDGWTDEKGLFQQDIDSGLCERSEHVCVPSTNSKADRTPAAFHRERGSRAGDWPSYATVTCVLPIFGRWNCVTQDYRINRDDRQACRHAPDPDADTM